MPEATPSDDQPTTPLSDRGRSCSFCGKPTELRFGGDFICLDCYTVRGSCCQEQEL